ncbi:siderophore-mediated iron transport protein, partial [Helicobacter pylori]
STHSAKAYRKA